METFGCCGLSSGLCFDGGDFASTALCFSLLPASCELESGFSSSSTGVGGSLIGSSSACWLSRTGSLPPLPPPTTGILLSPDGLGCAVFFSLDGPWRFLCISLGCSSVLNRGDWTPCAPVLFGVAGPGAGVERGEMTGQGMSTSAEGALD